MSLLDEASVFATVVTLGGFSRAAKELGVTNGLISRKIKSLEERLGASLLVRTTRQFKLTKEGELFLQHAKRMQQELETGICLLNAVNDKPKGNVRISTSQFFGRHFLMPVLSNFLKEFPDIKVELILNNMILDPISNEIDIVFRSTGFSKNANFYGLKGRLLMDFIVGVFASPEYLVQRKEPKTPDDLKNHMILGYSESSDKNVIWEYQHKSKEKSIHLISNISSNDIESLSQACIAGVGIGRFSELLINKELRAKQLKRVLEDYCWGSYQLYALYPNQASLPKRVRILLDYIFANLDLKQN